MNTLKSKLELKISDLLDKNVNFLFGSGASTPYIPTFMTSLTDVNTGKQLSFEDLLSKYKYPSDAHIQLIYYWYYSKIITKTYVLSKIALPPTPTFHQVNNSYSIFIQKLNDLLKRKNNHIPRRSNIFTTNYDLFFEKSINEFQQEHQLILNDGGSGIINRTLNISNFHRATMHQGTDDRYSYEIPTVNLIKMHGSVSWKKQNHSIFIDYSQSAVDLTIQNHQNFHLSFFPLSKTNNLLNLSTVQGLQQLVISTSHSNILNDFYNFYLSLPIVNPTKEKFSETVFQQHYYQSLRLLSQELERPQTVLICFGFSFADEHIREIIQRSLSNPELHVYIYAYSHDTKFDSVLEYANNVTIIRPEEHSNIPFDEFNKRVFG